MIHEFLSDAFVACGGAQDKSEFVRRETLIKIIKEDFGLTIDIEELINKIDQDNSGEIEFDEFKQLLSWVYDLFLNHSQLMIHSFMTAIQSYVRILIIYGHASTYIRKR